MAHASASQGHEPTARSLSRMTSPVRAQLEPWREGDRTGWRFIQCTDTLDEFKVLLPPRIAFLYQQLLSAESAELAKGHNISWDQIIRMRQLKDRVIRKCYRLIDGNARRHRAGTPTFQTLYAPPDFRCRELERWLRDQDGPLANSLRIAPPKPPKVEKARETTRSDRERRDRSMFTGPRIGDRNLQPLTRSRSASELFRPPTSIPFETSSRRNTSIYSTQIDQERAVLVESPEPLPLPFRPRSASVPPHSRDPLAAAPEPNPRYSPSGSDVGVGAILPDPAAIGASATRPLELRRKSSLRSGSGFDGPSKAVAWSMDRGPLALPPNEPASTELRNSSHELTHLRNLYEDEMSRIRTIKQSISERLAALLAETVKLQVEEASLRVHEQRLVDTQARIKELENETRGRVGNQAVIPHPASGKSVGPT